MLHELATRMKSKLKSVVFVRAWFTTGFSKSQSSENASVTITTGSSSEERSLYKNRTVTSFARPAYRPHTGSVNTFVVLLKNPRLFRYVGRYVAETGRVTEPSLGAMVNWILRNAFGSLTSSLTFLMKAEAPGACPVTATVVSSACVA